jgi:nitric oxide reductase large subunit
VLCAVAVLLTAAGVAGIVALLLTGAGIVQVWLQRISETPLS